MIDHLQAGRRGPGRVVFAGIGALSVLGSALARAAEGAAQHGDAHESSGLPQLDTSTFAPQVFWALVLFGVLYWLMSRVALPKVGDVLEERRNRVDGDLERAEQIRAETDGIIAAYEATLTTARAKAGAILTEAAQESQDETNARLAEVGTVLNRKVESAEQRIAKARADALAEINSIATDIAGETVRRLGGSAESYALAEAVKSARGEGV
jgi:F-type H+-transporting ATPase subunit b